MEDVAYCIPTRDRSSKQITLENLPRLIQRNVYLGVDEEEYKDHKKYLKLVREILVFPKKWGKYDGGASDKKQWMAEQISKRYMFILDDDLSFYIRKKGKLIKATKIEIYKGFKILNEWMTKDKLAHVSMSCREGNNRISESFTELSRGIRVVGFDLKIIKEEGIKFNRLILMSDFDSTLQLIELGYKNRILYDYAQGQRKSNDEGGCSIYRTPDTMKQAAMSLHRLHPKYVKVEEKKTSKPWAGFDTPVRTDVTVFWKKAFSGQRKKKGITESLKGG